MKDITEENYRALGLGVTLGQGDSDILLGQSTAPPGLRPKEGVL